MKKLAGCSAAIFSFLAPVGAAQANPGMHAHPHFSASSEALVALHPALAAILALAAGAVIICAVDFVCARYAHEAE